MPEVERIVARVGSDELGLDPMGLNETDTFLVLKPKHEWRVQNKDWLVEQLREAMAGMPGVEFAFTQPIEMRTAEMLTGARGDLAIKIFGPELATLSDLAGKIQTTLQGVPGASEVSTVANDTVDYLQIELDRLAAGRTGSQRHPRRGRTARYAGRHTRGSRCRAGPAHADRHSRRGRRARGSLCVRVDTARGRRRRRWCAQAISPSCNVSAAR